MKEISSDDEIVLFLLGQKKTLSKPQTAKLERLYTCDDLIRAHGIKMKVCKMLVSIYSKKYDGEDMYGIAKAVSDYNSTMYVFGSTSKHNRQYHIDLLLAKIEQTRQVALLTKNATAMTACDKNHLAVIEKFMGDKEVPDYASLQVPDHIISSDPKLLGKHLPSDEELIEQMKRLSYRPRREGGIDAGYTEAEIV